MKARGEWHCSGPSLYHWLCYVPGYCYPPCCFQAECQHSVKVGGAGHEAAPGSGEGATIYPQALTQVGRGKEGGHGWGRAFQKVLKGGVHRAPASNAARMLELCTRQSLARTRPTAGPTPRPPPRAATFDDALIERMASQIADEAQALRNQMLARGKVGAYDHCLSPHIAIARWAGHTPARDSWRGAPGAAVEGKGACRRPDGCAAASL